jgi:hypothetical protein
MEKYTIIQSNNNNKIIGLLEEISPNTYTIIHEDGTISGTMDITHESYSIISTHSNIIDLMTAIESLI